MLKYRGQFRVFMPKTKDGNFTTNDDDTYLKCKSNTEIYRYNENTLAIYFQSVIYAKNRIKDLLDLGVHLTKFMQGSNESIYLFPESQIELVAEILKPTIKGKNKSPKAGQRKVNLSEEQKEVLRKRMEILRKNKLSRKNQINDI